MFASLRCCTLTRHLADHARALSSLALLALAGLAACGPVMEKPPVLVRTAHGTVRAYDLATAREVARDLEALVPSVSDALVDARRKVHLDVRIVHDLGAYLDDSEDAAGVGALCLKQRTILLQGGRPGLRGSLAHELVHALHGASWEALPPLAEEGLASVIADRVVGLDRSTRARSTLGLMRELPPFHVQLVLGSGDGEQVIYDVQSSRSGAPDATDVLGLTRKQMPVLGNSAVAAPLAYGVGEFVVARILSRLAVEDLLHHCVVARHAGSRVVSAALLLELAELEPELSGWWPALLEQLDTADLEVLIGDNRASLERALCHAAGERDVEGLTLTELGWEDARLRMGRDGPELRLGQLPAFAGPLSCQTESAP